MNIQTEKPCEKPFVRPNNMHFSSGLCKKHPGCDLSGFSTEHLGRSHRVSKPKSCLKEAIDRSHTFVGVT